MNQTPRFDASAARTYDKGMPQRVPGYALGLDLAGAVLATRLPAEASILVVGAGTGAEILHLAPLQPGWRFTALDISADMLEVARQRCEEAGLGDRVTFVSSAMQRAEGLPAHDAALAQLVTQFVPNDEKRAFYAGIAGALVDGGPLLSLDYRPDLSAGVAVLRQWALQAGAPPEMAEVMLSRIADSWYIPTEDDLAALWYEAGLLAEARYVQALAYTGTILRRQR